MKKWIRWKGIILLAVLAGLFLGATLFFTDSWLESNLESMGTSAVGARVEFDGFQFSLADLSIRWNRLQVTDAQSTMQNVIETGESEFAMALVPLLSKKINIDKLKITGLRFNTTRETDGKISDSEKKHLRKTPEFVNTIHDHLKKETSKMPLFQLNQLSKKINVDSIYALVDLQSPQKIDSVKSAAGQQYLHWENRFKELPDAQEFISLQTQISALDPKKIKKAAKLKEALTTTRNLRKKIRGYNSHFKSIKSDFSGSLVGIKNLGKDVPKWIEQDLQQTLNFAKLPDISVKNIARLLFGQQLINRIESMSRYVGTVRYYAQKYQNSTGNKEETPQRLQGQYIHFGQQTEYPSFWIKEIALTGELENGLQLAGYGGNIVSDQKNIGQPTTFEISGSRKDDASVKFSAVFDYLAKTPKEQILLKLEQIPLNGAKLADFALMPSEIKKGNGYISVDINFEGDDFYTDIQFKGNQLQFKPKAENQNMDQRLKNLSKSIMASIHEIHFNARAKQKDGSFTFTVTSNLDNLIAGQLKKVLSGEVTEARKKLETKVKSATAKHKRELDNLIRQKEQQLTAQLDKVQKELGKYQRQIEQRKKDIEKEIKKKAGGILNNFLKKP